MAPKARAKKPPHMPLTDLIAAGAALGGSDITAKPRTSSRKRQAAEALEEQTLVNDQEERKEKEDDGGERRERHDPTLV